MRLATFNMRGGGSRVHWDTAIETLRPDILFVQETKDPRVSLADLFTQTELHSAVWSAVEHGNWGSALFVPEGTITPVEVSAFGGWIVGGEVRLGALEFFAFSVHLAPTKSSYVRSANRMLDRVRDLVAGAPVLFAGDWNLTLAPSSGADGPELTRMEAELLVRLKEEFGAVSAWTTCHPAKPRPQTLRWARDPTRAYHCDGIFIPTIWAGAVRDVRVLSGEPWTSLSDHNPVVAEIEPPT